MTLVRMAKVILRKEHTHKGLALPPGTVIEVDEARAERMVAAEIATKQEIFIVESAPPEPEVEAEDDTQLDLELDEFEEEAEDDEDGDEETENE